MKLAILIVLAALVAGGYTAPGLSHWLAQPATAGAGRTTMALRCHYNPPPQERCTFGGCDDAAAGDGE